MPKYRKFRIEDIFVSQCGDFDIQQKHINGKGLLVVSSGETNLGIIGKSDVKAKVFSAGTITIDMFGYANYRGHDYKMVTHARVFSLSKITNEMLTREVGMYFVAQFVFFKKIFSYNNMASWQKIKDMEITLPVTADGEVDFKYMEDYIRGLETVCIRELEAYFKVTGLSDYKITNDDLQFMRKMVKYNNYDIVSIFNVKNTHCILSSDIVENGGNTPYLTASQSNNAVGSYVSYDEKFLDKGNCVFIGGKTFVVSYQEKDFFSNDSHNLVLYLIDMNKKTRENQLFMAAAIYKSLCNKYSWGDSISREKIQVDTVSLPTDCNGNPDYDYMTRFIRIQQKLAIKKVVEWKNRELKT
jgi:hypothetical protein